MASASSRQSYGGSPPEPHHHNHRDHHSVILNPSHPTAVSAPSNTSSTSRGSGGAGLGVFKGSSSVAGKSDRKSGGGGSSHRTNTRVSTPLPTSAPIVAPSPPSNYLHTQHYPHQDMVVDNIAASTTNNNNHNNNHNNNNNTSSSSSSSSNNKNNHPITDSHSQQQPEPYHKATTQLNHHQNSSATISSSRKNASARNSLNNPEIITIDSDESESRINASRAAALPKISGPSLAGAASGNRSLLQPYDPIERPNLASASPSIASLIDPQPPPLLPAQHGRKTEKSAVAKSETSTKTTNVAPPATNVPTETKTQSSEQTGRTAKESGSNKSPKAKPIPRTTVSAAPSPPGNGLLSGDMFNPKKCEEVFEIPTIVIHVPLNGETNKYVNFAKLAEEKYGLYALNPRLAREHQQKLAGISGDEMMLDISDSESAIEDKMVMSGLDSTNDATKKKPRKRKIVDAYDSHDPFIDDSETLWEEQAAATKDGFFVYSGSLVPEGEKVTIERADGTIKRGRGRGRTSGATRATASKPAAPRKPRMTKKEKERLEREKEEQRLAALQKAQLV